MTSSKGLVLMIVLVVIVAIAVAALSFMRYTNQEIFSVRNQGDSTRALYIAEAGLERAFYDLKQDFVNGSETPSWADGDINGIDVSSAGPSAVYYSLPYEDNSIGEGTFAVEIKNIVTDEEEGEGGTVTYTYDNDTIWLKSTGTVIGYDGRSISRTVQLKARIRDFAPWNSVIFAGTGASGMTINGDVDIRGSVIVLGTGLSSESLAISLSGSGKIGNNYLDLPSELSSRIPACPTTIFGGEIVQSLESEVRIKNGKAGLSGSSKIGISNATENNYKETVDGVYITDGYGGNKGADNVYSDNGTGHSYDLGNSVTFPSISSSYTDPETSVIYDTYLDYIEAVGLEITETEISSDAGSFNHSDANGNSISWNKDTGVLAVNGIIYVNGNLDVGKKNTTINYTGKATLVSSSNMSFHGDVLSSGTFPAADVMGFVAGNNLNIATESGESQINLTGAFYAAGQITSAKQSQIAGSFVSNYFDMGQNVPSIYQVPTLKDNLPPGLLGSTPVWIILTSSWQEL